MDKDTVFYGVFAALFAGSVTLNLKQYHDAKNVSRAVTIYDTLQVTKFDTITYVDLQPKDTTIITYKRVRVPVLKVVGTTAKAVHETVKDTAHNDTAEVLLPIVQKRYDVEDATAWVSGYEPQLDSLKVYRRTDTISVIKTVTTEAAKAKRWGLGVTAGYGVTKGGVQPFVGVGVTYNILNF